jgi:hypothetical protein
MFFHVKQMMLACSGDTKLNTALAAAETLHLKGHTLKVMVCS